MIYREYITRIAVFCISSCAILLPTALSAAEEVTIYCNPQTPLVLTTVYCRASGIPYMERLMIQWSVDGDLREKGIGQQSFSFRTGPKGEGYNVNAEVFRNDGTVALGLFSFNTRDIGVTKQETRFRTLTKKSSSKFSIEISPPYPRPFNKVTLSIVAKGQGAALTENKVKLYEATNTGGIKWYIRDLTTPEGTGATHVTRLGNGIQQIPFKVVVEGLDEVEGIMKPVDNFIPEYDNAARAALCAAQTLDMFADNLERIDKEITRTAEQFNNMLNQLDQDVDFILNFWHNLLQDIEHDIEITAGAAQAVTKCNGITSCLRAGASVARMAVKVYTGADGYTARRIAAFNKAIENITTFKERIDKLILEKKRILNSIATQTENQLNRCERAFNKVNTHGLSL